MMVRRAILAGTVALSVAAMGAGMPGTSTKPGTSMPAGAAAGSAVAEMPGRLVSVSVKGVAIHEAFAQLQQQTNLQFSMPGGLEQKEVTLETKDKPLWETVRALVTQVDSTAALTWAVRDVGSPTGSGVRGKLSTQGPFLVAVNRITHQVSPVAGRADRYRVNGLVFSDSTVVLSGVKSETTPVTVVDEQGRSMVWTGDLTPTMARPDFPLSNATEVGQISIILQSPKEGDAPKKIVQMEGIIPATLVQTEKFEVELGKTIKKDYGKFTAEVQLSSEKVLGNPVTRITVRYAAADSFTDADWAEWRGQAAAAKMHLLDTEGKPLPLDGMVGYGTVRRTIYTTQDYPPKQVSGLPPVVIPAGTPAKVVVDVPVSFKAIGIPYHFKDIDLP